MLQYYTYNIILLSMGFPEYVGSLNDYGIRLFSRFKQVRPSRVMPEAEL